MDCGGRGGCALDVAYLPWCFEMLFDTNTSWVVRMCPPLTNGITILPALVATHVMLLCVRACGCVHVRMGCTHMAHVHLHHCTCTTHIYTHTRTHTHKTITQNRTKQIQHTKTKQTKRKEKPKLINNKQNSKTTKHIIKQHQQKQKRET